MHGNHNGKNETTMAVSYSIYSQEGMKAEEYGKSKWAHWGIENSLHRVLDIRFREDKNRIRAGNAAENVNGRRHIGTNLPSGNRRKPPPKEVLPTPTILYCCISQLHIYILSAIYNPDDRNCLFPLIRNIEYDKMIHWHLVKPSASPWFFFIQFKLCRHICQFQNVSTCAVRFYNYTTKLGAQIQ